MLCAQILTTGLLSGIRQLPSLLPHGRLHQIAVLHEGVWYWPGKEQALGGRV